MPAAERRLREAAHQILRDQLADVSSAASPTFPRHMLLTHARSSAPTERRNRMGWFDAYVRSLRQSPELMNRIVRWYFKDTRIYRDIVLQAREFLLSDAAAWPLDCVSRQEPASGNRVFARRGLNRARRSGLRLRFDAVQSCNGVFACSQFATRCLHRPRRLQRGLPTAADLRIRVQLDAAALGRVDQQYLPKMAFCIVVFVSLPPVRSDVPNRACRFAR